MSLLPAPLVCPRCFRRPALRWSPKMVAIARVLPPETTLGTFKCERRGCIDETGAPTIGEITAGQLARAVAVQTPPRRAIRLTG